MLKRYVGSADEVEVVVAGVSFGLVNNGDAIPVPDELANSVSWPEDNWEDVTGDDENKEDD